jgi:multiple sugar transport system substrate-binding protein
MNRKLICFSIAFVFIFIVMLAPLGGCQPAQNRLTLAVVSGVEGEALRKAASQYRDETGVVVEVVEFPYNDLYAKELLDLNTRSGSYDLVMLDDPWFPRFAEGEMLADLGPMFERRGLKGPDPDFIPASINLCRHPYETGALYALPYVGNSQLFFYRKDLFEKYSLTGPGTWQDVLTAARVIHENESQGAPGGNRVHGYVMRAARGNSAVADFMPIFWAFGAEMFDSNGRPSINSVEGVNALRFMLELGRYCPPSYVSFGADEVSNHLLQGTAAMSINWPAWISAFADPNRSRVLGLMEFASMPSAVREGRSEIGNWLIGVPRGSRNADAAFDFLLWATAPERMKQSALSGNPPTRRSVFTDPEMVAKFPSYPAQLRSLEASRPRPRTPLWNEVENVFGIYLSRANAGEMTAEKAMEEAQAEVLKIIERPRERP